MLPTCRLPKGGKRNTADEAAKGQPTSQPSRQPTRQPTRQPSGQPARPANDTASTLARKAANEAAALGRLGRRVFSPTFVLIKTSLFSIRAALCWWKHEAGHFRQLHSYGASPLTPPTTAGPGLAPIFLKPERGLGQTSSGGSPLGPMRRDKFWIFFRDVRPPQIQTGSIDPDFLIQEALVSLTAPTIWAFVVPCLGGSTKRVKTFVAPMDPARCMT